MPSKKAKKGEYLILDTLVCDKKKAIFLSEEWWKTICSSFLSKDRLSFLGSNFLPVFIVDKILKPFVTLVKNDLDDMTMKELKAMAKEIGCSVKGKTKKIQLIFEIVRAEKTPR